MNPGRRQRPAVIVRGHVHDQIARTLGPRAWQRRERHAETVFGPAVREGKRARFACPRESLVVASPSIGDARAERRVLETELSTAAFGPCRGLGEG
jgi:hypothetical protein